MGVKANTEKHDFSVPGTRGHARTRSSSDWDGTARPATSRPGPIHSHQSTQSRGRPLALKILAWLLAIGLIFASATAGYYGFKYLQKSRSLKPSFKFLPVKFNQSEVYFPVLKNVPTTITPMVAGTKTYTWTLQRETLIPTTTKTITVAPRLHLAERPGLTLSTVATRSTTADSIIVSEAPIITPGTPIVTNSTSLAYNTVSMSNSSRTETTLFVGIPGIRFPADYALSVSLPTATPITTPWESSIDPEKYLNREELKHYQHYNRVLEELRHLDKDDDLCHYPIEHFNKPELMRYPKVFEWKNATLWDIQRGACLGDEDQHFAAWILMNDPYEASHVNKTLQEHFEKFRDQIGMNLRSARHKNNAIAGSLFLTSILAALAAIAIPVFAHTKGRKSSVSPPTYHNHDPMPRKHVSTPAPALATQKHGTARPDVVIQLPQMQPAPGTTQPSRRSTVAPSTTGPSRQGTLQQHSQPQQPVSRAPEIVLTKQDTIPPQPPNSEAQPVPEVHPAPPPTPATEMSSNIPKSSTWTEKEPTPQLQEVDPPTSTSENPDVAEREATPPPPPPPRSQPPPANKWDALDFENL